MRKTICGPPGPLAAVMVVTLPGPVRLGRGRCRHRRCSTPNCRRRHAANATHRETRSRGPRRRQAHPDMARASSEVAILAKPPKKAHAQTHRVRPAWRIVTRGIEAAPRTASDISHGALDCARIAPTRSTRGRKPRRSNGVNAPDGSFATDDYGGFGVGFGPGFPGSPGFTGSAPSGAIALPPVATDGVVRLSRRPLESPAGPCEDGLIARAAFVFPCSPCLERSLRGPARRSPSGHRADDRRHAPPVQPARLWPSGGGGAGSPGRPAAAQAARRSVVPAASACSSGTSSRGRSPRRWPTSPGTMNSW